MTLHSPVKSPRWPSTSPQASARMARVRLKATGPEQRLGCFLCEQGLEFVANDASLPGSPDIVFANERVAVFVHGCFWHGHAGCRRATVPLNNQDMWLAKIQANIRRDRRVSKALRHAGWSVLTNWECQQSDKNLHTFLRRLRGKMQLSPGRMTVRLGSSKNS